MLGPGYRVAGVGRHPNPAVAPIRLAHQPPVRGQQRPHLRPGDVTGLDLDRDLLGWITGEIVTPQNYDTPLFRRLKAFHTHTSPIHS